MEGNEAGDQVRGCQGRWGREVTLRKFGCGAALEFLSGGHAEFLTEDAQLRYLARDPRMVMMFMCFRSVS